MKALVSKCVVCGKSEDVTEDVANPEDRLEHRSKFTQCLDGDVRCSTCYAGYVKSRLETRRQPAQTQVS